MVCSFWLKFFNRVSLQRKRLRRARECHLESRLINSRHVEFAKSERALGRTSDFPQSSSSLKSEMAPKASSLTPPPPPPKKKKKKKNKTKQNKTKKTRLHCRLQLSVHNIHGRDKPIHVNLVQAVYCQT